MSEEIMLSVTLPIRLGNGHNDRTNPYMSRERHRREKDVVRTALAGLDLPPLPVIVRIVRVSPYVVKPDLDNVIASAKWVRDAIAETFDVDDGDSLIDWEYGYSNGHWRVNLVFWSKGEYERLSIKGAK